MMTPAIKLAKQVLLPIIKWSMLPMKKQKKKWLQKPKPKLLKLKAKAMTWD